MSGNCLLKLIGCQIKIREINKGLVRGWKGQWAYHYQVYPFSRPPGVDGGLLLNFISKAVDFELQSIISWEVQNGQPELILIAWAENYRALSKAYSLLSERKFANFAYFIEEIIDQTFWSFYKRHFENLTEKSKSTQGFLVLVGACEGQKYIFCFCF